MRTITLEIYSYDELSEESKKKAYDNFYSDHIIDVGCYRESLDEFCSRLDITWSSRDMDTQIDFDYKDERLNELVGLRLGTYLNNNFRNQLGGWQTFYLRSTERLKIRTSKILRSYSCTLTGSFCDDLLVMPMINFMNKPETGVLFIEILKECGQNIVKYIKSEIEFQGSLEFFIEQCDSFGYEFYQNGERI